MLEFLKFIYQIFYPILQHFKYSIFRYKWRLRNSNNKTFPRNIFNTKIVSTGRASYGPLEVYGWGASEEHLKIGKYVSIAPEVKFILGGNHPTNFFSTYPFKVEFWGFPFEATSKGPVVVQDDVWIGTGAIILSGITLGQGCVVAAGSVVTKSIPPYAIVAGNPAKMVRYRFSEEIITLLQQIDYSKLDHAKIDLLKPQLEKPLTIDVLEKIVNTIGQ